MTDSTLPDGPNTDAETIFEIDNLLVQIEQMHQEMCTSREREEAKRAQWEADSQLKQQAFQMELLRRREKHKREKEALLLEIEKFEQQWNEINETMP